LSAFGKVLCQLSILDYPIFMKNLNFYESLPAFKQFPHLFRSENYKPAPDDWFIVLTDIKGSTKAIGEGRYKDVNTIGAACIVAVQGCMDGEDIPYVFGGDGATLLVPPTKLDAVVNALSSLQTLSEENFKLSLRVGVCSVGEIHEKGALVEIARFELVSGKYQAFFRGQGLALAEKFIKENPELYEKKPQSLMSPDLSKLSCRWQPLPNKRGKILTLIIQSRKGLEVYERILKDFDKIFPEGLEVSNPVNTETAKYRGWKELLNHERKLHHSSVSLKYFLRAIGISISVLIFKTGLIPEFLFPRKHYQHSLRTHSDYRKFDDVLRSVMDCSEEESRMIKNLLASYHSKEEIYYGIHESETSLMTCYLIEGTGDGGHIHFIDGNDGGYALAAKQMKQQML
jgi:Protein of unknown function (DUF3095)